MQMPRARSPREGMNTVVITEHLRGIQGAGCSHSLAAARHTSFAFVWCPLTGRLPKAQPNRDTRLSCSAEPHERIETSGLKAASNNDSDYALFSGPSQEINR